MHLGSTQAVSQQGQSYGIQCDFPSALWFQIALHSEQTGRPVNGADEGTQVSCELEAFRTRTRMMHFRAPPSSWKKDEYCSELSGEMNCRGVCERKVMLRGKSRGRFLASTPGTFLSGKAQVLQLLRGGRDGNVGDFLPCSRASKRPPGRAS